MKMQGGNYKEDFIDVRLLRTDHSKVIPRISWFAFHVKCFGKVLLRYCHSHGIFIVGNANKKHWTFECNKFTVLWGSTPLLVPWLYFPWSSMKCSKRTRPNGVQQLHHRCRAMLQRTRSSKQRRSESATKLWSTRRRRKRKAEGSSWKQLTAANSSFYHGGLKIEVPCVKQPNLNARKHQDQSIYSMNRVVSDVDLHLYVFN